MKRLFLFFSLAIFSHLGMAQNLRPNDSDAVLNVSVMDYTKKPIPGEHISFTSKKNYKTYSGTTDSTGKFHLLIPKGTDYEVHYTKFTSEENYNNTLTIPKGENQLLTFNYTIRVQLPVKYTLKNVFFDFNKATITDDSYKELNRLAVFIKAQKTMVIEIAGYTDNIGTDAQNLKLSQARADAIRNYLLKDGVLSPDKIIAKGYGASDPVASNDTPDGRKLNRRTEVHIIKQ